MNNDALRKMILAFKAPCEESGKYGCALTFGEWSAADDAFRALEAANAAKDEALRNLIEAANGFLAKHPARGPLSFLLHERLDEAKAALTTSPTGMVLVEREKLEDLRDLARTGTPPATYGLDEDTWAHHRLSVIAANLAALLKEG